MSSISTPSGKFIEGVFANMAYQPDDVKAISTLNADLHPDFTATINGHTDTKAEFVQGIVDARAGNLFKVIKSEEIVAGSHPTDKTIESVGHIQMFSCEPKEAGKPKTTITSLTLCQVKVAEDGSRKFMGFSEVTKNV